MLSSRFVVGLLFTATITLNALPAAAQNFPSRSVRIFTGPAGGGADLLARLVAQGASAQLGQPVIVENVANSVLPVTVSKAAPDGYTLLLSGSSFWIGALMQAEPYDVLRDFSPVVTVVKSSPVLVVHPSVGVTSVKELVALAKAKPGALNFPTGGIGSTAHFAAELFKSMAGINIVRIDYKGAGPAMNAIMGGEVQLMFASSSLAPGPIKAGRLKALATAGNQPTASFPDLPTVATAVPGYAWVSPVGVFAPVRTPSAVIDRLNRAMAGFIRSAEAKEKFVNVDGEPGGGSPEELAAAVKNEMAKAEKIITESGLRVN